MSATTVRDAMTPEAITMRPNEPVRDAAVIMASKGIGDVVITHDGGVAGILTDRDIVLRVVAEGRDPDATKVGDVSSTDPIAIDAEAPLEEAAALMRKHDIRRLPVVDGGAPIGFLTLADIAQIEQPDSTLADIAAAEPDA